jgi:hypothetical protein
VSTGAMRVNTWPWKLEWGLVEVLRGLAGGESERRGECTATAAMADRRRRVRAQGWGEEVPFK